MQSCRGMLSSRQETMQNANTNIKLYPCVSGSSTTYLLAMAIWQKLSAQEILVRTVIVWEVHVCVLQVSSEQSLYTRLCYPELCISASVATDLQYFKISTSELYNAFLLCYTYFISFCLGLQSSVELLICFIYLHLKLIHMYILRCRNKIDSFEMYRTWYRLKVVLLILSHTSVFSLFCRFWPMNLENMDLNTTMRLWPVWTMSTSFLTPMCLAPTPSLSTLSQMDVRAQKNSEPESREVSKTVVI